MSDLVIALGTILLVLYVISATGFTGTFGQIEERKIYLQSIPTDKSNVNTDIMKEQWFIEFNQLLSKSQEGSDDN
jgi:hypothetical protein